MSEDGLVTTISNGEGAEQGQPLLSVCIATRNRGNYIGHTLDNILEQCEPSIEVVVVDGASTDNTAEVVGSRAAKYSILNYYPQVTNSGIDGDFDKAVGLARGRYCWLMSDDDLLAPGAITRVLAACRRQPDAVIVDAEVRTADLSRILVPHRLTFSGERRYRTEESDRLFIDCGQHLNFIGCLIVRRDLWQQRIRMPYYGSEFIHVGVLFQAPLPRGAIVLAEPLVRIRYGVGNWTGRSFQVWMFKWPALVWSFDWLVESARSTVSRRRPWLNPVDLILYRAKGWYSWREFIDLVVPQAGSFWRTLLPGIIALIPGRLLNLLAIFYARLRRRDWNGGIYDLKRSRYYVGKRSRG
jgi:abequosyltransferase